MLFNIFYFHKYGNSREYHFVIVFNMSVGRRELSAKNYHTAMQLTYKYIQ